MFKIVKLCKTNIKKKNVIFNRCLVLAQQFFVHEQGEASTVMWEIAFVVLALDVAVWLESKVVVQEVNVSQTVQLHNSFLLSTVVTTLHQPGAGALTTLAAPPGCHWFVHQAWATATPSYGYLCKVRLTIPTSIKQGV